MCTCFFLLHHIDMHEKKGQSYSNYRIVYDIKKENSGNENYYIFLAMIVHAIVFNNIQ